MERQEHWENVHTTKGPTEVSWFTPHLDNSLRLIELADLSKDAAIIDVGCGASTLVDDLLNEGYKDISCMDIAESAYAPTLERLGERAKDVC